MDTRDISEILKDNIPIPAGEIPRLFDMLVECRKETEITRREEKRYDAMKEVMIRELTGKYGFYEFLFSKIFSERQEIIKKDFQIIDEGMKKNNRELINAGIAGLSQIVASSPIEDMDKLRRMLGQ